MCVCVWKCKEGVEIQEEKTLIFHSRFKTININHIYLKPKICLKSKIGEIVAQHIYKERNK